MKRNPWQWIPTLYFAEGIPYVVVMSAAVAMFKLLGISNADIAFYTSWLYLPWVVKPLWSPLVDLFKRKRWWIVATQWVIGCSLAAIGLSLPGPDFFRYTLIFLWLMAFSSATHDIAADGFYMIALSEREQSFFVGIRNTFYRLASATGQGLIVVLAGFLARPAMLGDRQQAWAATFGVLALLFVALAVCHGRVLPRPAGDVSVRHGNNPLRAFFDTFVSFVRKPGIGAALAFMLLFRFAEAQLVKMASPFLLDTRIDGGLALSAETYGIVYGSIGVIALTVGGILGGILVSRGGLRRWFWPMVLAMNLPNLAYVYLAAAQPESLWTIGACVSIEQFGYGFGYTAYTLYLILFSNGENKTAHYALCTGLMALGMMIPGMFSGEIQEAVGYTKFFIWVVLCTIPSFAAAGFLRIPESFGQK
jgi:PAT family beta-lactamase induction signal transducer AmpG